MGNFKIMPVFKKEGNIYTEITEYPKEIIEPLA